MEDFILYVMKSAICLSFFLGIYLLFLRRQTFFRFNRIFLLMGLLLSFVTPSIAITYDVVLPYVEGSYASENFSQMAVEDSSRTEFWHIVAIIYALGAVLLVVRNINIFKRLSKLKQTGSINFVNGYCLVEHSEIKTPFSVFNNVYMNTKNLQGKEKDIILKHEISHICQKHWIDLLCSECALLLLWFNPLMWYYIHLQKENHEYLADQAVLCNGESIAIYRAVLVNQQFQGPIFSFANSFNYSNQQNRLSMMKKTKTSPWKKVAALAVLPLFGAFIALSAKPNYVVDKGNDTPQKVSVSSKDSIEQRIVSLSKDSITVVGVADGRVIVQGVGRINSGHKPLMIVDGKEVSKEVFEKIDPKKVESISVLRDISAIEQYGKKGESGVILVKTKGAVEKDGQR